MLVPNRKEVTMDKKTYMTEQEIFREEILQKIVDRKLSQVKAAEQLNLSK